MSYFALLYQQHPSSAGFKASSPETPSSLSHWRMVVVNGDLQCMHIPIMLQCYFLARCLGTGGNLSCLPTWEIVVNGDLQCMHIPIMLQCYFLARCLGMGVNLSCLPTWKHGTMMRTSSWRSAAPRWTRRGRTPAWPPTAPALTSALLSSLLKVRPFAVCAVAAFSLSQLCSLSRVLCLFHRWWSEALCHDRELHKLTLVIPKQRLAFWLCWLYSHSWVLQLSSSQAKVRDSLQWELDRLTLVIQKYM